MQRVRTLPRKRLPVPQVGTVGPDDHFRRFKSRPRGADRPIYPAFSHSSYASNECGRPRKSFTSSAAGFDPPASRIALR